MKVSLFLLALLFSLMDFGLSSNIIKRRAGDQAPQGQCTTFKWGGVSRLHWYVCCNNCDDKDASCDGKTYQSASSTKYCDSCGTDNKKGNGQYRASYGCVGCARQNSKQSKCTANLRKIYNIPGFCWAFTFCFHHFCSTQVERSTDDQMFNLRCDPGENVNTNPTDCCVTVNPQCDHSMHAAKNECPPDCCGEPGCCLSSGTEAVNIAFFACLLILIPVFL